MSKYKLLFVAPYAAMISAVEQITSKRDDIDVVCFDSQGFWEQYPENASVVNLESVQKALDGDYDVILSRFGSAAELRGYTHIPVVDISVSDSDMIRAFKLAEQHGGKAVVVGVPAVIERARKISQLLEKDIDTVTLSSLGENWKVFRQLKSDGYNLVIGGTMAVTIAKRLNMNNIFLTSGYDVIEEAVERAVEIARRNRSDSLGRAQQIEMLSALCDAAVLVGGDPPSPVFLFNKLRDYPELRIRSILSEISGRDSSESTRLVKSLAKADLEFIVRPYPAEGRSEEKKRIVFIREKPRAFLSGTDLITLKNVNEMTDYSYSNSLHGNYIDSIRESMRSSGKRKTPVLIIGEAGTGKTSMALDVYRTSSWSRFPIAIINCTLLTQERWNAIINDENSVFTLSDYTLFFKNVQDIPEKIQSLLASYIYSSRIYLRNHLIFTYTISDENRYREPPLIGYLKYELCCLIAELPSLNQRADEMKQLVNLCISDLNTTTISNVVSFTDAAIDALAKHRWRYNIRELQQAVRSIVMGSDSVYIGEDEIDRYFSCHGEASAPAEPMPLVGTLEEIEREIIARVMAEENNNQTRAAERLGISRSTLWRRLKNP